MTRLTGVVVLIVLAVGLIVGLEYIVKQNFQPRTISNHNSILSTPTFLSPDYYITHSDPVPTAPFTWKKYFNQQLGISFEYPVDWIVIPEEDSYYDKDGKPQPHISRISLVLKQEYMRASGNINVLVSPIIIQEWDNPTMMALQAYNQALTYDNPNGGEKISPDLFSEASKATTIAGKPGYYSSEAHCDPVYCDQYVVPYNNKFIELKLLKMGRDNDLSFGYRQYVVNAIFAHIVSTLELY